MAPIPAVTTRLLLRQSRFLLRRPQQNLLTRRTASTATETASAAKETAQGAVSKASEGLSRVTSSGGAALVGAAASARNALGKVGGRTGRLIAFVESLIPPTVYYARVGLELSKIMFQGQKMAPPSISQFQTYLQPILSSLRSPSTFLSSANLSPEIWLSSIRNLSSQQLAAVGVVAAEVIGFFTVGTMIGRLKIVGYHGEPAHGH